MYICGLNFDFNVGSILLLFLRKIYTKYLVYTICLAFLFRLSKHSSFLMNLINYKQNAPLVLLQGKQIRIRCMMIPIGIDTLFRSSDPSILNVNHNHFLISNPL